VKSVSDTRLRFAGFQIEFDNITPSAECEIRTNDFKFTISQAVAVV
jgi:hypothetical protein